MKEKVKLMIQGTEIREFEMYLYERENAEATIRKYITDLKCFFAFLGEEREVDKPRLLSYKEWLLEHYAVNSVNSMLAALNQFLIFCGHCELKIRRVKTQKNLFLQEEKELTRQEYTPTFIIESKICVVHMTQYSRWEEFLWKKCRVVYLMTYLVRLCVDHPVLMWLAGPELLHWRGNL